jgi:hypothetical protein
MQTLHLPSLLERILVRWNIMSNPASLKVERVSFSVVPYVTWWLKKLGLK